MHARHGPAIVLFREFRRSGSANERGQARRIHRMALVIANRRRGGASESEAPRLLEA